MMDVYADTNDKLIPFVHYFVMLAALFPSWSFIYFKKGLIKKSSFIFYAFVSIFVVLNYLSRQFILIFLISSGITYLFYNKVNFKKIAILFIVVGVVFFVIGNIRINQLSVVKETKNYTVDEYMRNYSQAIVKTSLMESYFITYSSVRFNMLNNYISKQSEINYHSYGKYTLKPLISLLLLDRLGILEYNKEYTIEKDIPTYAIDPFLDFGFLGVIIINLIYGSISITCFLGFERKDILYIIPWVMIMFCIIMMPFMNYFNTFFVWFAVFINRIITKT
jgi:hypothetical protein